MNLRRGRAAHLKLGRAGERAAARYFELCGCRILGRISMDYTVIDLSGFITDDLTFGEPVTCFGTDRQECITAGDWGRIAGTHAYNVLTGIGPRVLRVYKGE